MDCVKSADAFERAKAVIPGGVNSPVRSFYAVGGLPRFIVKGKGSKIYDIDGNEYIDYVCSWGPLILGHCDERVISAVAKSVNGGLTFGAPTEGETKLAELICESFPSVEKVRLVNSGTEAVMSALRLARAYTGREKIIKCAGCYHGHVDNLLVQAGSGLASLGLPGSKGISVSQANQTVVVPYNDSQAVRSAFEKFAGQIAAIIVEPVAGNMGVVPPKGDYLAELRRICDDNDALLIFDEVITGFRIARGGAQELFGIRSDITILGKIIGGGMPVGAYGGRSEIMDLLAPLGQVYQAGTLSGNPIAVAAGIATIEKLNEQGVYNRLEKSAQRLEVGLLEAAERAGVKISINRVGSMLTIFFADGKIENYEDVAKADKEKYSRFFHLMLDGGIYLPPSAFESMFVSLAHSSEDIEFTIERAGKSFEQLRITG